MFVFTQDCLPYFRFSWIVKLIYNVLQFRSLTLFLVCFSFVCFCFSSCALVSFASVFSYCVLVLFVVSGGVMLRVCPPQVSVFSVQILGNLECLCIDILVIDVLEFSVVFSNVF